MLLSQFIVFLNAALNMLISFFIGSLCILVLVLIHELGHAVMYRITAKSNNWIIVIGAGKPIIQSKKIIIKAYIFAGAYCRCPDKIEKKSHRILVNSGGFLFNIIFLFILNWISQHLEKFLSPHGLILNTIIPTLFFWNIGLILLTIFPITYKWGIVKGYPSDGLSIYREVFGYKKSEEKS